MPVFLCLILLVMCTALVVGLAFRFVGGFCAFVIYQGVSGNDQVFQIYKTCVEKKNSGVFESTRVECVARLAPYMFEAIGFVIAGDHAIGVVESGFAITPEENTLPPLQRGDKLTYLHSKLSTFT